MLSAMQFKASAECTYNGGKTRLRREWRGLSDTWYDYTCWVKNWGQVIKFAANVQNLKGFFRYRWMLDYLAALDLVDRSTMGTRGTQLRIAHENYDFVVRQIIRSLTLIFKADRRLGGSRELDEKTVVLDENMMEEIMFGFPTLTRLCPQLMEVFARSAVAQHSATHYIDKAEEYGITGDVCTMPKAELGVAIEDDNPIVGKCLLHSNTTCDTSLMGNGIEDRRYNKPAFAIAAPHFIDDKLIYEYAVDEIKAAISFVERETGEKWDWAAYFENMRLFNAVTRSFLEILEMQKTDYPQVPENNYAIHRDLYYMRMLNDTGAEILAVDDKIRALMYKGYAKREKLCREHRHRALMWGVQAEFYTAFPNWLINCWGIIPITHFMNLTSTELYAETDTPENREQAYYDLADLYIKTIMRNRSESGLKYAVDDLWRFCEEFNCDMVIMYEQMACKAMMGYHGIFDEEAAKRGIHIVWVTHCLLDPRKASRQNIRDEVNRYMRTVLGEEPLDASLEVIADDNAW